MFGKKKKNDVQSVNEPIYENTQPYFQQEEQVVSQQNRPRVTASWKLLNNNGPVPVAPPADFIQLTPIVQPIPLVPYSTQLQPILTFDEDENL